MPKTHKVRPTTLNRKRPKNGDKGQVIQMDIGSQKKRKLSDSEGADEVANRQSPTPGLEDEAGDDPVKKKARTSKIRGKAISGKAISGKASRNEHGSGKKPMTVLASDKKTDSNIDDDQMTDSSDIAAEAYGTLVTKASATDTGQPSRRPRPAAIGEIQTSGNVSSSAAETSSTSSTPVIPDFLQQKNLQDWGTNDVFTFLNVNKNRQFGDEHIKVIQGQEVAGIGLLELTKTDLIDKPYHLKGGPAAGIDRLVKDLKVAMGLVSGSAPHAPQAPQAYSKMLIKDAFPNGLPMQKPKDLLRSSGVHWEYQPDQQMHEILGKALMEHYINFNDSHKDKSTIPTYLFLSGAGTGKSRNANEFRKTAVESLSSDDSELASTLRTRLSGAWVFNVSFETGNSIRYDESNPYLAIGNRMLLQLLPSEDMGYISRNFVPPEPLDVLKIVAKHEKRDLGEITVILVVDGLHAMLESSLDGRTETSPFYQTLSSIGDLALGKIFLIPCCTATITGPVYEFLKLTHRKRIYLPVASLKSPMIRRNGNLERVFQDNYIVSVLVDDCGGHGRALEGLEEALGKRDIAMVDIDTLMKDLRGKLLDKYCEALNITRTEILSVAQAILTRQLLDGDKVVPGTTKLPEQFAQPGLIRYERKDGVNTGYLTAPYIWVWMFVHDFGKAVDPVLKNWRFCDYAEHVSEIDSSLPPGAQFWQHFEYFVASFRVLKSRMYEEGETVKISQVHAGARLQGDFEFENHQLEMHLASHQEDTKSASHVGPEWKIRCEKGNFDFWQHKYCIINAASAQYADSFTSLHRKAKKSHECHQDKLVKSKKLAKSTFEAERYKAASKDDFFILFTSAESCNFELPNNSGIVDKTQWESYFGPFAGRAYRYAITGPLKINDAERSQLTNVFGISEARADEIMEKRPFDNIEDATNQTNIPERVLKRFKFPNDDSDE